MRITTRPGSAAGGVGRVARSIRSSSVGSCGRAGVGVVQRDAALRRVAASLDQPGELLVVDERDGLLALHHLGELRAGERRC